MVPSGSHEWGVGSDWISRRGKRGRVGSVFSHPFARKRREDGARNVCWQDEKKMQVAAFRMTEVPMQFVLSQVSKSRSGSPKFRELDYWIMRSRY